MRSTKMPLLNAEDVLVKCVHDGSYMARCCAAPDCPLHMQGVDADATYTIVIPGAFDVYLDGTSLMSDLDETFETRRMNVYSEHDYLERAAYELRAAIRQAPRAKRGRGTTRTVTVSRPAVNVLWGYADTSIDTITMGMGADERRWYASELRAARRIDAQIRQIVPGAERWA